METPEKIVVTRDPEVVFRADRIVLPGVGAFADCARARFARRHDRGDDRSGVQKSAAVLRICVGMQ